LAVLVHRKTGGNPFFAVHFLGTLEQRGLLGFVASTGSWRWDADRIATADFTDNVVDLLVARVRRLPPDTQTVLQICACLGSAFDLGLLSRAFARDVACLEASLRPALEGELLLRTGTRLRFGHDRVQEAAYSLIPEEERPAIHLRVGRLLAEHVDEREGAIFEVVGHLNRGAALLETAEERVWVAHLDLAAARRAKKSAAFDAGLEYADRGMALLSADAWDTHHDLCSGLHFAAARCALATGQAGRAEPLVDALRGRARTFREDVDVTRLGIDLHTLRGDQAGGAQVALDCLRRLGTDWPAHPSLDAVVSAYDELQRILGDRSIEDLAHLPRMENPRALAVLDLLNALHDPAMFTDANLIALLGCEQARLSVIHGNAPGSAPGYGTLALIVGPMFGRYADAPRWGCLGTALAESRGRGELRAMVLLDSSLALQWAAHLRETLDLQLRAHRTAVASGNYKFACYALNNSITARIVLGERLADVEREADDALRFVRRAGFPLVETIIDTQRRLIRQLRGREERSRADEAGLEAALEAGLPDTAIATCLYFVWKLEALYLAGDFEAAVSAARRAEDLSWASPTFVEMSELHYFHGLALAARWDAVDVATRETDRRKLREIVARFHDWASLCPANFAHRHALLAGELARIESRHLDAEDAYEEAIRCARRHGFVNHAGVSLEVASRAWDARGFRIIADAYLHEARACYDTWGADGPVGRLDRRLAERGSRAARDPSDSARAVTLRELDLISVVKASQTISSVIDRERLVRTLLEVVLERGGARVARIVLTDGDRPTLVAEASVGEQGIRTAMLQPGEPGGSPRVAETIFQYVRRTRERVVLDDATADPGAFGGDPYLASARPRSLACLPILREGAVIALLDLENDLVPGVFTAERLTTLELLAAQAAISLENARLVRMSEAARRDAEAARVRAEVLFEERRRVAADSRFLADASEALAGSLDYESTLSRVAHLAVPFLADWCVVDILEDGSWRRVARAHVDPAQEQLLAELEGFPVDVRANLPAALAIAEGRTVIVPDFSDDDIRTRAQSEEHATVLRALRPRRIVVVPLLAHGQVLGAMSFVASRMEFRYDDDAIAVAEELGRRAAVALDNARLYREAQASILARDEFLSTASHELRSPVNALLLAAQGLGRGTIRPTPDHLHVVLGLLERQAFRLSRLIDEMLLVGRLHLGRLELDVTEVDLASVVQDVMDDLAAAITESGCAISLQSTTRVVGRWDRDKIAAVVTNLLDNALKFGRGRPVEIALEEAGDDARLRVTDHGIGIDPEALPHVFDKFTRAVSTRSYGGLGLGLHIVRGLVAAHGGSVTVTSEPGVSTTFTIVLPRRRDE
jgi:signal transduction histidine kinase